MDPGWLEDDCFLFWDGISSGASCYVAVFPKNLPFFGGLLGLQAMWSMLQGIIALQLVLGPWFILDFSLSYLNLGLMQGYFLRGGVEGGEIYLWISFGCKWDLVPSIPNFETSPKIQLQDANLETCCHEKQH